MAPVSRTLGGRDDSAKKGSSTGCQKERHPTQNLRQGKGPGWRPGSHICGVQNVLKTNSNTTIELQSTFIHTVYSGSSQDRCQGGKKGNISSISQLEKLRFKVKE